MIAALKPLPFLALLALAAPLAAQDAPAADDATETPDATPDAGAGAAADDAAPATPDASADAPAATPAPGSDLSMGSPADAADPNAAPQPGQPYIRETFGDWSIRCLKAEEGPDPCQLYQLLSDDQGNTVAEISMFPLPEGGQAVAGATIVTPLETLLTENLTLSVDGHSARRYPFTFCNAAGCVARVGFTADEIAEFRAGSTAEMTIVPAAAPDQKVNLRISLSGFTAGYGAAGPGPAQ